MIFRKQREIAAKDFVEDCKKEAIASMKKWDRNLTPLKECMPALIFATVALIPMISTLGSPNTVTETMKGSSNIVFNNCNIYI